MNWLQYACGLALVVGVYNSGMKHLGVYPYESAIPEAEFFFVGPQKDGPAVTVRVDQDLRKNCTRLTQSIHSIAAYNRPPTPDETYPTWLLRTDAEDMTSSDVEDRLRARLVTDGRPVVRWALEVRPPLQDPQDVQRAVGVFGRQLRDSRQNPDAVPRMHSDLAAEGVPFESLSITMEVLSNEAAQEDPHF